MGGKGSGRFGKRPPRGRLTVRLPAGMVQYIKRITGEKGITIAAFFERLIENHLTGKEKGHE